jgi:predicted NAD/FAD-binding protein
MVDHYLLPMAGAIWSAEPRTILDFPASRFGSFFVNHGLLQVRNRVRWRTVSGGARQYVRAISAQLGSRLRLNTPVEWIQRLDRHVLVKAHGQPPQEFDGVVIACHSDQALRLLRDPGAAERDILGKMRYQANEAVLHTDASLMPRRRRAWASWNYHRLGATADGLASVTYNLSTLQNLPGRQPLLVTLNTSAAVDPDKVLMRTVYDHPVFDAASLGAQQRRHEISGRRRTWYCGAYWGYGFHEDGAASAAAACDDIEQYCQHEELPLQGTD